MSDVAKRIPTKARERLTVTMDNGWVADASSFVSLLISFGALAFTGLTYRDRRKQDRRDLFLAVHERLVEPDLQRGRRLLFQQAHTVDAVTKLRDEQPDSYDCINRALAMFDVAAMYVAKGYVSKEDFLAEWGPAYGRLWLAADAFLTVRFEGLRSGERGWPHLRSLGSEAANALGPVQDVPPAGGVTRSA